MQAAVRPGKQQQRTCSWLEGCRGSRCGGTRPAAGPPAFRLARGWGDSSGEVGQEVGQGFRHTPAGACMHFGRARTGTWERPVASMAPFVGTKTGSLRQRQTACLSARVGHIRRVDRCQVAERLQNTCSGLVRRCAHVWRQRGVTRVLIAARSQSAWGGDRSMRTYARLWRTNLPGNESTRGAMMSQPGDPSKGIGQQQCGAHLLDHWWRGEHLVQRLGYAIPAASKALTTTCRTVSVDAC